MTLTVATLTFHDLPLHTMFDFDRTGTKLPTDMVVGPFTKIRKRRYMGLSGQEFTVSSTMVPVLYTKTVGTL